VLQIQRGLLTQTCKPLLNLIGQDQSCMYMGQNVLSTYVLQEIGASEELGGLRSGTAKQERFACLLRQLREENEAEASGGGRI
jgi:hypothetical protein